MWLKVRNALAYCVTELMTDNIFCSWCLWKNEKCELIKLWKTETSQIKKIFYTNWIDLIAKVEYCKQFPKWDNKFLSVDVYCQIINNRNHTQSSYLYEAKRRDACTNQQREKVCERTMIAVHWDGVRCKNSCWKHVQFRDKPG